MGEKVTCQSGIYPPSIYYHKYTKSRTLQNHQVSKRPVLQYFFLLGYKTVANCWVLYCLSVNIAMSIHFCFSWSQMQADIAKPKNKSQLISHKPPLAMFLASSWQITQLGHVLVLSFYSMTYCIHEHNKDDSNNESNISKPKQQCFVRYDCKCANSLVYLFSESRFDDKQFKLHFWIPCPLINAFFKIFH